MTGPFLSSPPSLPRRWLHALAIGLGTALPAQSLGLDVAHYGQQSGVPKAAADQLGISMVATPSKQMIVQLWGGRPGALAGIVLGRFPTSLPIFGARLLVVPDLSFFSVLDGRGEAEFSFPLLQGLDMRVQGVQMDLQDPGSLFAMTWGLEFHTVTKQPSTAFDVELARVLMELSYDAYEKRKGTLAPGMRLDGGFQVLSRIESQNPSDPWFKRIKWPATQLFIARNASSDLAVVFAGTDLLSIPDWKTQLQFDIVNGVHGGKRLAFLAAEHEIRKALLRNASRHARVLFSGHSMGGGLATIAADRLAPALAALGVAKNDVVLYSFGSARVMDSDRARQLGANVPHHYAVTNKDDPVTHFNRLLPPKLVHIPSMRVIYPRLAVIAEDGSQYRVGTGLRLTPLPYAHKQAEYTARLGAVLDPPDVWLTVSPRGNMTLNLSFSKRAEFLRDRVALYRFDPSTMGTDGFVRDSWRWASAQGSFETPWPRAPGFHIAYIQESDLLGERKFLATKEFESTQGPVLSLTKPKDLVILNWSHDKIGTYDWVAVYQGKPTDPKAYLCGGLSWQWALGRTSHVTNWREARDLYIGYVAQETALGPGTIVKVAGPYDFAGQPSVQLTWKDPWPWFLTVSYANARINTFDWVAIYDRDPEAAGAIRLFFKRVIGTGSARSLGAWKRGYYAAHFEQDCLLSPSKLVAKFGPLQ